MQCTQQLQPTGRGMRIEANFINDDRVRRREIKSLNQPTMKTTSGLIM